MIRRHSIRFLLAAALVLSAAAAAFSQAAGAQAIATVPEFSQVRLDTFNKVWNTINEKHYDPTFNGVDWKAVREAYLPKAQSAKTDDEFHGVLRQMLGELKLSHFNIFPPPPAIGTDGERDGSVGIEIKWIDGKPVVTRVQQDSPAEKALVKPGFVVSKIDGKLVSDTLKPLQESLAKRSTTEMMKRVYLERTAEALAAGKPDSKVMIEF